MRGSGIFVCGNDIQVVRNDICVRGNGIQIVRNNICVRGNGIQIVRNDICVRGNGIQIIRNGICVCGNDIPVVRNEDTAHDSPIIVHGRAITAMVCLIKVAAATTKAPHSEVLKLLDGLTACGRPSIVRRILMRWAVHSFLSFFYPFISFSYQ